MDFTSHPQIVIDGMNLALPQGTGIATYGRNLCSAITALGASVGVLYGRPIHARDGLLREVTFSDSLEQRTPRWLKRLKTWTALPPALAGVRAEEIPQSGAVVAEEFAQLPLVDQILNVPNLFQLAYSYFDAFGSRLKVRVPNPPKVMHWTYPVPIQVVGAKNIYTMHDLVPLRLPNTTLDKKKRYLSLVRMLARSSDHIVTVSEASRRDIVNLLGVEEHHVTNTYQCIDLPASASTRNEEEVRREVEGIFGLEHHGYFLFYGAIEPKKNVNRLIQAYLSSGVEAPLVILGKHGWKCEQELALLQFDDMRAALAQRRSDSHADPAADSDQISHSDADRPDGGCRRCGRIIQIDYVASALVMSLVQGAKAVLFPSLYEGFGLPVLEAMSLGAPVITSTTSSLPELAGDAAILVDPYNPQDIAEALRRIDADSEPRRELARRGLHQARRFSKEAYQARLRELYRQLGVSF